MRPSAASVTRWILLLVVVGLAAYDLFTFRENGVDSTISRAVFALSGSHPTFVLDGGTLVGHFLRYRTGAPDDASRGRTALLLLALALTVYDLLTILGAPPIPAMIGQHPILIFEAGLGLGWLLVYQRGSATPSSSD